MAKIVIADDSFLMRKNLKTIFIQAGYEVVAEAGNGKAAVKAYKDFLPDIMTMDITMPSMSGIDAVKEIVTEFPDAKIIMITALDQKHMVFQAISNGAKHYIMKPFNVSQVLSVVKTVLEGETAKKANHEPFSVKKEGESYIVGIKGALEEKNFTLLQGTVQGLLMTENSHIIFDLTDNPFSNILVSRIEEIVEKIPGSEGSYSFRH
jgi:YesN/AraC family two-component response regulator